MSVGELARRFPVSRPAVSRHLRVLEDAGLIETRSEGKRSICVVRVQGLAPVRAAHGDWMPLGGADENKPAADGTVEAWEPVGGWYGLEKNFRGRFGVYVPPVLEASAWPRSSTRRTTTACTRSESM